MTITWSALAVADLSSVDLRPDVQTRRTIASVLADRAGVVASSPNAITIAFHAKGDSCEAATSDALRTLRKALEGVRVDESSLAELHVTAQPQWGPGNSQTLPLVGV